MNFLIGSQIVAEQWSDKLIVYLYDASGAPIGMMYRTTSYAEGAFDVFWFEKNVQGDIVAVYNESGTKVATYTYSDAWGNHTASYTNGGASTGAQYNPFRYRGYYYDFDLGMYYLQSRYYDAKICRFISPDTAAVLTAIPMALTDKNLYAYCDNNPVTRVDGDGEFWLPILIGAIVVAMIQGNWSGLEHDINSGAVNPFNTDEQVALESEVIAFYKGELVVRHSIPNTSSAQIFGTIFLNSSEGYDSNGINTLNHERGHGVQEKLLGTGGYLVSVGFPSMHYCIFGDYQLYKGTPLYEKKYFSKVWERTADWLGGVDRGNYYDFCTVDNFIFW